MNRKVLLVADVISWVGIAFFSALHVMRGNMLIPVAMLIAFGIWSLIMLRHHTRETALAAEA